MPPSLLQESRSDVLKKSIAVTLLWGIILAILIMAGALKWQGDQACLDALLGAEIEKNKTRVEEVSRMSQLLEQTREHANVRPTAIEIFSELHRAAPDAVKLEMLDYEDGEALILRGNAAQLTGVFQFAKALEKSAHFSAVRVRYVSKRPVGDRETADFEIVARIKTAEIHENP